jgi:tetratricopeptide (TPR) repeat protein
MSVPPLNIALRYSQRRVLLLSLLPLGLLSLVTVMLSRTYHLREALLAQQWFEQGNRDMATGTPAKALEDFRNALSYNPSDHLFQLRLAEALLAGDRLPEANSYLLNLWDRTPGSGQINLDLAHISERMGQPNQAIRYFRQAILGSWETDPAQQRKNVRMELSKFLLDHGSSNEARQELSALAAEIPPEDGSAHELVGELFVRAEDNAQAFAEFEAALRTDPHRNQWLGNAGQAAYDLGDYQKAEHYLAKATRESSSDALRELLETVRTVLRADPYLSGLSDEEQVRRTTRAFGQGMARLHSCTASFIAQSKDGTAPQLQTLAKNADELKNRINIQTLSTERGTRDEAMRLVFQIEEETSRVCGAPSGVDQALLLIGNKHAGAGQ